MSEPVLCDECGRMTVHVHRIHKGHRYCAACYKRVFKYRLCPKCGNRERLPKDDPNAVCLRCQTAKPCARCGKTDYAVVKVTPYGPVCGSCAHYFREPEACEGCGVMSTLLTRVSRLGGDKRLCPKCARAGHGTCPACHRPRLLLDAPDGRRLCRACLTHGDIPCPVCTKPMPAGRRNKCEDCYWTETLQSRVTLDQAALSSQTMVGSFGKFGVWLLNEIGSKKAAITIHRYLAFFQEMDRRWGTVPTYAELLECFGAEGLRRVRLVMRWLVEAGHITLDAVAREEDSERRRIEALVALVPAGSVAGLALIGYRKRLMSRVQEGKSSLRSVRLGLRPAVSLLLDADPNWMQLPDQVALDRYLLCSPGQKAAVTGFVNYLMEVYKIPLVIRVDAAKVTAERKKRLEVELKTLWQEGGEGEEFQRRWISVALAYFHGVPRNVGVHASVGEQTVRSREGISVSVHGTNYWLPIAPRYQGKDKSIAASYSILISIGK